MKKICFKIVLICFLAVFPAPIQAQTISLSIWPPLLDTVIQPGKAITQVFRLTNLGDDTVVNASVVPFEPSDELGHITLSKTASPALSYFSLQNADLDLPAIIALKTGQTQEFVLKIKIPETAPDSDHYFSFLFSADTQGLISASGARTLGSIAANILLTVSQTGVLQPMAKIEQFSAGPIILDSFSPLNFILRLKNTTSTRLAVIGQIELKNTFNRTIATLPIREDNVLAHSIRQLITETQPPQLFLGRYTATATITPRNTANTISQTIHFYVLPYKALLVLILLFTILTMIRKKIHNNFK
ncbi:MAG: hypothetical protein V1810_01810 [Candidatus Beckwithbacteria bacterium]